MDGARRGVVNLNLLSRGCAPGACNPFEYAQPRNASVQYGREQETGGWGQFHAYELLIKKSRVG